MVFVAGKIRSNMRTYSNDSVYVRSLSVSAEIEKNTFIDLFVLSCPTRPHRGEGKRNIIAFCVSFHPVSVDVCLFSSWAHLAWNRNIYSVERGRLPCRIALLSSVALCSPPSDSMWRRILGLGGIGAVCDRLAGAQIDSGTYHQWMRAIDWLALTGMALIEF